MSNSTIPDELNVQPSTLTSNPLQSALASNSTTTGPSPSITARDQANKNKQFMKQFNRLYDQFYQHGNVDQDLLKEVSGIVIPMDLFDKITLGKQYQRCAALVDGKIRFDDVPLAPHGDIIGYLNIEISMQL
jgi:hypothetical protein